MWKGFQKPKRLAAELESLTDKYGKVFAQPFERGWGTTGGNSLRRTLLSSIEGAAITAVRVEGVLHEFSSIPGVVEDTTDIILNLKQIPSRIHSDHPETLVLQATGPKAVKAGDIHAGTNVEILDATVPLATLSEDGKISMEMRLRRGRGYVSADRN